MIGDSGEYPTCACKGVAIWCSRERADWTAVGKHLADGIADIANSSININVIVS